MVARIRNGWVFGFLVAILGCSTTGAPQTDYYHPMRGGFVDFQIAPGLFRIEAKSERAYSGVDAAAREAWRNRGAQLCGSSDFRELAIYEGAYAITSSGDMLAGVVPQQKIGVKKGYLVCKSANLTDEEAISLIRGKGWPLK